MLWMWYISIQGAARVWPGSMFCYRGPDSIRWRGVCVKRGRQKYGRGACFVSGGLSALDGAECVWSGDGRSMATEHVLLQGACQCWTARSVCEEGAARVWLQSMFFCKESVSVWRRMLLYHIRHILCKYQVIKDSASYFICFGILFRSE